MNENKKTVVLLGDSTIDNKLYTNGHPSVAEILRKKLGNEWKIIQLAFDGHHISDVYRQLKDFPESATHIVLSVGGNDALYHSHILESDNSSSVFLELAAEIIRVHPHGRGKSLPRDIRKIIIINKINNCFYLLLGGAGYSLPS